MTTTTTKKTTRKLVKRVCRWLFPASEIAEALEVGGWAPFLVAMEYSDGSRVETYYVATVRPDGQGWYVSKEDPSGGAAFIERYTVDDRFGPDPEKHWVCDCPDAEYRARCRKPGGNCKHCLALGSLLAKAGLLRKPAEAKTA